MKLNTMRIARFEHNTHCTASGSRTADTLEHTYIGAKLLLLLLILTTHGCTTFGERIKDVTLQNSLLEVVTLPADLDSDSRITLTQLLAVKGNIGDFEGLDFSTNSYSKELGNMDAVIVSVSSDIVRTEGTYGDVFQIDISDVVFINDTKFFVVAIREYSSNKSSFLISDVRDVSSMIHKHSTL